MTPKPKRKKAGRPREGSAVRVRCSIRLEPHEVRVYTAAGDGDLSAGIRRALAIAGDPSTWTPPPMTEFR